MTLYEILGVSESADNETIKKAYRKLAVEFHPDKTGGDKQKEEKFKEISSAYQTLSDPNKRAEYDAKRAMHARGRGGMGGGMSFEDLFQDIFGDVIKPRYSVELEVTLEEVLIKKQKKVSFSTSQGPLHLNLNLEGVCEDRPTSYDLKNFTLDVNYTIKSSPYQLDGYNIIANLDILYQDLILGGEFTIDLLDGPLKVKVNPLHDINKKAILFKNRGLYLPNKTRGNLMVKLHLKMPTDTVDDEKKFFEEQRLKKTKKT